MAVWCFADVKYQAMLVPSWVIMSMYFLSVCFILVYLNLCDFLASCRFLSSAPILSNMTFYVMPNCAQDVSCPILSYDFGMFQHTGRHIKCRFMCCSEGRGFNQQGIIDENGVNNA